MKNSQTKKPASAVETECTDKKCPFHGSIKIRGRTFTGIVVGRDTSRSATVSWEIKAFMKKYERYYKKRSKVRAHNPPCINAQIGDIVKISECRPISKTKSFVITEKIGKDVLFNQKKEALEEAKSKEYSKVAESEKEDKEED